MVSCSACFQYLSVMSWTGCAACSTPPGCWCSWWSCQLARFANWVSSVTALYNSSAKCNLLCNGFRNVNAGAVLHAAHSQSFSCNDGSKGEPLHGYCHVHVHLSYFIFREALKEDLGPKARGDRWLDHIIVWRHSCQFLFITHGGFTSKQYKSKRLFHFWCVCILILLHDWHI